MNVYCISGLGADRRAFERIKLPAQYRIHHVDWIPHLPDETLENYGDRLAAAIDNSKPFILVGLSMGGMIASTLSEKLNPACTILISSASNATELPWYDKLVGRLNLDKLVPSKVFTSSNPLVYFIFGARTKSERRVLKEILDANNPEFLKWGVGAIIRWKQPYKPANVFHIHGTADRILPYKYMKADVAIDKGTHFMIWTKAGEVTKAMLEIINRNYRP